MNGILIYYAIKAHLNSEGSPINTPDNAVRNMLIIAVVIIITVIIALSTGIHTIDPNCIDPKMFR